MATTPLTAVIQRLRAAFAQDGSGMTDGQLLTLFLEGRDECALAALVRRHSPMVWGVCCRLLSSHHDAEDAFQATFLVLVRKAASVKPREAVANWLYGVAYQTAVRVRAMAAKRGSREKPLAKIPDPLVDKPDSNDYLPLLDQELNRLPNNYRLVLVLADLEGKTRKELAQQLGISEGTVAGRLARARQLLAKRLARRGVVLSAGTLAATLAESAATAAPPALVAATIRALGSTPAQAISEGVLSTRVVTLTERVVRAMFVTKIKGVLAILLPVAVVLGALGVGRGLVGTLDPAQALAVPLSRPEAAQPQVVTGGFQHKRDTPVNLLGQHGLLFIRSRARLDELTDRIPELKLNTKVDFGQQTVVLAYAPGHRIKLSFDKYDFAAIPPEVVFSWRHITRRRAVPVAHTNYVYVITPGTSEIRVINNFGDDGIVPAAGEVSAILGGNTGDIVDGLQATITPQASSIRQGEDILIDFTLKLFNPAVAGPDWLGITARNVFVWDGKYSNGYRNHAFFVTTPDGTTALLRPRVIDVWDKNAPHPVEITAKSPYQLPNWQEGSRGKSLKALGLDTNKPGIYTITGLYEQRGDATDDGKGGTIRMWGGSITSNTIAVEVKKGD